MGLFDKLLNKDDDLTDSYKMGNLYVGYIFCNSEVKFVDNICHTYGIMHGPIICYKPPMSSTFIRVSNGVQYLENTNRNNSQQVGDSYFKIIDNFINFVHTYMYGFEGATKRQYLHKDEIINVETLLQRHEENLKQEAREQYQNQ